VSGFALDAKPIGVPVVAEVARDFDLTPPAVRERPKARPAPPAPPAAATLPAAPAAHPAPPPAQAIASFSIPESPAPVRVVSPPMGRVLMLPASEVEVNNDLRLRA